MAQNKRKKVRNVDIWKSEQAMEIFLSLVDYPKSQEEISEETGYWQGRISELLPKLEHEKLIEPYQIIPYGEGRKRKVWCIYAKPIFNKIIFFKNPQFSKNSKVDKNKYKELPKLIINYLKIVARLPRWRSKKWFENHIDKLYLGDSKKEKKEELDSWDANIPLMRSVEFNLQGLAEQFIEYLLVNRKYSEFTEEHKREMMQLIESYHLSNNSRDLRDVNLDKRKGRLTLEKGKHSQQ